MDYYTSDLHLGHENILKHRPMFETIEEMNEVLIDNWNKKVKNDDIIYIVGDFSFRSKTPVEDFLERLKGKKHLILGNHDSCWLKKSKYETLSQYFESICHMNVFNISKKKKIQATLCHYPMLEWNESRYASNVVSYLIHGHIHNNKDDVYDYIKEHQPTALNCGVDVNNFEPVTLEELIENNKIWYDRKSNE